MPSFGVLCPLLKILYHLEPSHWVCNQATIFVACPKPGLIGRVVPGMASSEKMVGMTEVRALIRQHGWQSIWIIGASACVILHFTPEHPEDGEQRYDIWVSNG